MSDPDRRSGESLQPAGSKRPITIDVTGGAVLKIVLGLLVLAFVADVFARLRDILVWALASLFLAVALNPLVERLEPRIGRKPAATVVVLGFVLAFIGILIALVAPFVTQVDELSTAVPQAISDARENSTVQRLDERFDIAEHARGSWSDSRTSSSAPPMRCWAERSRSRRSSS